MAFVLNTEENRKTDSAPSTPAALQYGASGDAVKELQKKLNSLGYNLDEDGSFGPATQAAVKDYQGKNGLTVDGSVGPQTSALLWGNTKNKNTTPSTPVASTPAATGTGGTAGATGGNGGYQSLNTQMYSGINATLGEGGTYKDKYGNTIREPSQEAVDAAKAFFDKEVGNTAAWIADNPGAVQDFAPGEFDELYGSVYTTAPNGTRVLIKDLVNVGSAGTYTYDEAEKNAAIAQGYTVTETTYAGKPAWYIEGIKKEKPEGTSGADEDILSNRAYAALKYEEQLWDNYNDLYEAALANGNSELAEQYLYERDQCHARAERIRANSWLGGYFGGSDGSMYFGASLFDSGSSNGGGSTPGWSSGPAGSGFSGSGSTPTGTAPEMPLFDSLQTPEFGAVQVPTAPDVQINDYSQYIEEMQKAKNDAALAELEAAYNKNVNSLDRAGVGIDEAYQAARNQTAGAADLASRNFAEVANASGLNSGAGGQAALSRSVGMQNNLNALNMQEAQTLADLQQQRVDNDTWYNGAIAQAKAEGDAQTAQLLYQEKIRVESATLDAIQQKFANEITNYQLQMDAAQQQFANEVTKKQLEYQQLRDSVSDAQWQAQFDFAYNQWMQNVQMQQAEMLFQREQWEKNVEYQQAQLEMQKQSLNAELQQMATGNNQWQQQFDAANSQWQQEFDAAMKQYQDALAQQQWENAFASQQYQDAMTSSDAYKEVNKELVAMVMAGANLTEIRAALRGALNEGILTKTEYEQLCAAYTPGWST